MTQTQKASIIVYTSKPRCVDCNTIKQWLQAHGYSYTERNIRTHPIAVDQLKQPGLSSVPVTGVIDTVIDGLDLKALQAALIF